METVVGEVERAVPRLVSLALARMETLRALAPSPSAVVESRSAVSGDVGTGEELELPAATAGVAGAYRLRAALDGGDPDRRLRLQLRLLPKDGPAPAPAQSSSPPRPHAVTRLRLRPNPNHLVLNDQPIY